MPNSFLNIHNQLKRLVEYYVENRKTSSVTNRMSHTYLTKPHSQFTYILEPKSIDTFLDVATEVQKPLLNVQTFYMHDVSAYQQTPYNSLIFEIDGYCYKSKNKTSEIIERFATYNDRSYESLQIIGQMVGITQKCPYVIGDLFFAPDRGTTKNEANWLALHHLLLYEQIDENTHFLFSNNHELFLPLNKNAVNNIIERAFILHRLEQIFILNCLEYYDRFQTGHSNQNVVTKMNHQFNFKSKIPTSAEVIAHLSFMKAIEIAAKIMGISHLTTDEIKEYYPTWRKKNK